MGAEIVNAILEREQRIFARRSRPGLLSRVLGFRRPPVHSFSILQRTVADPQSLLCGGDVIRAWLLDSSGIKEIGPDPEIAGEGSGRYWHRQQVEFFISDDGHTIILNEMEGPKDGTLILATMKQRGDKQMLKVQRARIVLKGNAIG